MIPLTQARDLPGATAYSRDDKHLGTVRDVATDPRTGLPGYVSVESGLLGRSTTWVPVLQATFNDLRLDVPYDADQVEHAPDATLGEDGRLDADGERALREHYRLEEEYGADGEAQRG